MDSLPPPPPPPSSPFPSSVPPPMPAAPKKGGSGKWVLIGCGGCLGLIVIGVIASVAIYFAAMNVIKKTDVYETALKRVQNSAEVQAALGTPIETGWAFAGSVNYNNGSGKADFTAPVTGPKGEGTLAVKANKSAGAAWEYSQLEVALPDGKRVDLREAK